MFAASKGEAAVTKKCIQLMREAYQEAHWKSTDTSTKVGAVLAGLFGPTVFIKEVNSFTVAEMAGDPRNHKRPRKYQVTEHAERAAIYKAARMGLCTKGLTMICPWACCTDCARAIVLAGIIKVVAHRQAHDKTPERWRAEIAVGIDILERGGVEYQLLDAKIGGVENLFDGKVWYP